MHWAIAAHISPKNGRIHHSKFPSAGNVHGNKNYAFSQCKSCLHIADFHQPTLKPYENKWVALVGNKVVAAGESVQEVKQKAEQAGHTDFMFHLVPSSSVLLAP
jgi:hypothetical protein